jgi:predicted dehydrogenase
MAEVGIGMIGCGGFGRKVTKAVLKVDPRLRLRGLCDPDPGAIEKCHDELDSSAAVYGDHESLVAADNIDWVMIASWNCVHKEHAIAALNAGKHVFCQKPLATNFEDCLAMQEVRKASEKLFSVGFSLRYSPHCRKVCELLHSGVIGEIVSMEFNEALDFMHGGAIMGNWRRLRKNAGTHLLEKCCHDIDLVNWMIGAKATRVASFGGLNFFKPENEKHIERLGQDERGVSAYLNLPQQKGENPFTCDKDIADSQVAIIEYDNGVRATFHANMNAAIPERRMYVCGTEGTLRADIKTTTIEVRRIGFDEETMDESVPSEGNHAGGDVVLAKELSESMLDGATPKASFEDGLKSSITCLAIDEAMDTGRVVDLASYWEKAGL